MSEASEAFDRFKRLQAAGTRLGLWDAEVVSLDDPSKSGRVKVRVFLLHGTPAETPDSALPWAEVAYQGGAYDAGEFDPPPVGVKVLVGFRMGEEDMPIVMGTVRGKPTAAQLLRSTRDNDVEPKWASPAGESETPKDVFQDETAAVLHPQRRVWRKSLKGHTIVVEEKDGSEFLKIIDRVGQTIEMSCPVTQEENSSIAAQRGLADASRGTQFDQERLVESRGYIRICDVAGQEILLDGRSANENILIANRNRSGARAQTITMSNKRGKEYVQIEDQDGNIIRLNSEDSPTHPSVEVRDRRGSAILMHAADGTIRIEPAYSLVEIVGKDKEETIEGSLVQVVKGDAVLQYLNNMEPSILGNLTGGIIGDASMEVGGGMQLNFANVAFGGIPRTNLSKVLDILAALGGFSFQTLNGAIQLLNGVNAATPTGLVAVGVDGSTQLNTLGLAKVQTLPGGLVVLDGATKVSLGSAAAWEPVVKGFSFSLLLQNFLENVGIASKAALDQYTAAPTIQAIGALAEAFAKTANQWASTKVFTE